MRAPMDDRWLYAWGVGYAAAGAASLLLPLYALSLGGGAFAVGVLASTAAFAGVPGALLWGWLADRTGRRRIFVLVALAASALLLSVAPLVRSIPPLVLVNGALWFVLAAASPVLTLLVVDGTPAKEWEERIALLNTYQGYGWVGGLALGAIWTPIGARLVGPVLAQRALFWLAALAAAVALALAVGWLPRETTVSADRLAGRTNVLARLDRGAGRYVRTVPFATTRLYWGLRNVDLGRMRQRFSGALWAYLLAVAVFSAGFAAFWGPLPAFLRAGYSDATVFWLFLAANLASAAFYGRAAGLSTRRGAGDLQGGALAARAVLFPLVGVVALAAGPPVELPVLLVLFAAIGLTWAVIAVTATALVVRLGDDARGEALGAYAALAGIGGGVGSILGGWLASTAGPLVAFGVAGGTVLASLLIVVGLRATIGESSGES